MPKATQPLVVLLCVYLIFDVQRFPEKLRSLREAPKPHCNSHESPVRQRA